MTQYGERLRGYAGRLLRGSGVDADDVMQEVWLRVHAALPSDDALHAEEAWLHAVVRNRCLDELRARKRMGGAAVLELEALPTPAMGPEDTLVQRELLRETLTDIAALDARQRQALTSHVVDGDTHDDIAARLGTTPLASRQLLARARANLARQARARGAQCPEVRLTLADAQSRGVRPSEHARLHLNLCRGCRAWYRRRSRAKPHRALLPLFSLFGGWSLKPKLAVLGVLVASASGAIAAQEVLLDPPRAPQTLPEELTGAYIAPGTPLPRGVALVQREVRVGDGAPTRGRVELACPRGYRATQLLGLDQALRTLSTYLLPAGFRPMARARTAVTYAAPPGAAARIDVGIVCRTPAAYARDRGRIHDLQTQFRALARSSVGRSLAPLAELARSRGVVLEHQPPIPAGRVEHGIFDRTVEGVPERARRWQRTEWWADRHHWQAVVTDRATGRVVAEDFGNAGRRPGPGSDPRWTAFTASSGLLQIAGMRTVAGRRGVVLRSLAAGSTRQELVVEARTYRPLERTITADNGVYGEFRGDEVLVKRELLRLGDEHPSHPPSHRVARGMFRFKTPLALAGVAAGLTLAVSSASASDRTADLPLLKQWDTTIPTGQVEHGILERTVTGVPPGSERHQRTEWWADADKRWYARTTDLTTGRLTDEAFGDATGVMARHPSGPERVTRSEAAPPPTPGSTAAYNRALVERGVIVQNGSSDVAGLRGLVYRPDPARVTTDPNGAADQWVTDTRDAQTEIVLEAGTLRALRRTTTMSNGVFGQFRADVVLVKRELLAATEAPSGLRAQTFKQVARVASARRTAASTSESFSRLRATPQNVRSGHATTLKGRLRGARGGVVLAVQVRQGGAWKALATTSTRADGTFAYRHRFANTPKPTTFVFRVRARSNGSPATSQAIRVRVRP